MDPSTLVLLLSASSLLLKNGLYYKAIYKFNQIFYVEFSGVPVVVIVLILLLGECDEVP